MSARRRATPAGSRARARRSALLEALRRGSLLERIRGRVIGYLSRRSGPAGVVPRPRAVMLIEWPTIMRILFIVPWAEKLGGAEAMLDSILAGAGEAGHEAQLGFLAPGPWPEQRRAAGFSVEVIPAGRLRALHRWAASVWRLARLIRRRRPDLVGNWSAKTQLYGAPAAVLAGRGDRVVWWQQLIPSEKGWLDRCATLLPTAAVGCYSTAAAEAQRALSPSRRTFVVSPGAPAPAPPAEGMEQGAGPERPAPALEPGVPVVGLVGRLQPWKGQDRLPHRPGLPRARGPQGHQ